MIRRIMALCVPLLALTGCNPFDDDGDSGDRHREPAVTAPYAVLDLSTRRITYRNSIPDLATDDAYRRSCVVFRQVGNVYMAVFELTRAQWTAIAGSSPWTTLAADLASGDADPGLAACNLDYDSVIAGLASFTLAGGGSIDLPTAAEWDAACGTTTGWSWGGSASLAQLRSAAVVYETAGDAIGPWPVGGRSANAQGIYDMHGNVWEWNRPGDRIRGGSWRDSYWQSRVEVMPGSSEGIDAGMAHALIGARLMFTP